MRKEFNQGPGMRHGKFDGASLAKVKQRRAKNGYRESPLPLKKKKQEKPKKKPDPEVVIPKGFEQAMFVERNEWKKLALEAFQPRDIKILQGVDVKVQFINIPDGDRRMACDCGMCKADQENKKAQAMSVEEKRKARGLVKQVIRVGDILGQGASKTCWTIPGDDKHVALVSRGSLRNEYDWIMQLEEAGIPVWKPTAYFGWAKVEGGYGADGVEVFIMERAACGSRGDQGNTRLDQIMNERTMENLSIIKLKMLQHRVYIEDLQFLFKEDGAILVSDPGGVSFTNDQADYEQRFYPIMKEVLTTQEQAVEYALHRKAIKKKRYAGSSHSFYGEAKEYWRTEGEKKVAKEAAMMGVMTDYWEVKPHRLPPLAAEF